MLWQPGHFNSMPHQPLIFTLVSNYTLYVPIKCRLFDDESSVYGSQAM